MADFRSKEQAFWDRHARRDPLWAILSDPTKTGRRWDLPSFLETGRREISLLMYQLGALDIAIDRRAALDFGCGIGRLTQPLAGCFDRVIGLDVSPEMIRLAGEINAYPDRVRYVHNAGPDLAVLGGLDFTFIYSNVVLQHIEPDAALIYLKEMLRVSAPGGVLVFQLPSHLRRLDERQPVSRPMPDAAYRAAIRVHPAIAADAAPGSDIVLTATVTNTSGHAWSQREFGPLRLGNHWLARRQRAMLIQDDGRAMLPADLAAGQSCQVALQAAVPRAPGDYLLECDVVHEGISWFADKGSPTWTHAVQVGGVSREASASGAMTPSGGTGDAGSLSLSGEAAAEECEPLPMHGIRREIVEQVIRDSGSILVHVEADERCGPEWVGYRYFVRKAT